MASPTDAAKSAADAASAAAQRKTGGIVFARNNVPNLQRMYQRAYAQHVRIWNIHPRSRFYMRTYLTLFYSTMGATLYMCGRKAMGYNTWFSSE
jgi:hypothetical protein